jgi:hypothetical protein
MIDPRLKYTKFPSGRLELRCSTCNELPHSSTEEDDREMWKDEKSGSWVRDYHFSKWARSCTAYLPWAYLLDGMYSFSEAATLLGTDRSSSAVSPWASAGACLHNSTDFDRVSR